MPESFDRFFETENRFSEIEAQLGQPEVVGQPQRYTELLKEYKRLEPTVLLCRRLRDLERRQTETRILLTDSEDPEWRVLAQEELRTIEAEKAEAENELKLLLLPRDPLDKKNVIVEIRACAGGEEAALFAGVLYRMYMMYAQSLGYSVSLLNQNPTELGGFREVTFQIEGDGAYSRFKFESGVHRVQRVPTTESQGRIQTSTATVAVLPEAEPVELDLNPADIQFETCKSSGAGGQHINKTESAVRLIHKPTGIVVECQEERSQYKNRDKAMMMLCSKLLQIKRDEQDQKISAERRQQVGSGDRSEKIRTYNYPQSRVTDHRIGLSLHDLESVLNGRLSPLIDALLAADAAEKMKRESTT